MLLLFAILLNMDTWGLVPKSQINAETIEAAIIRLIAEHTTDPLSHTGINESLEAHRIEGILDHRAGSVLADKWTMTEFSITDDFRTLTHWQQVGDITNNDWPSLYATVEWGVTNKSEVYRNIQLPAPYLSTEYDQMFQVTALFDYSTNSFHAWLGIGLEDELPADGYGYVITSGVLRAVVAKANVRTVSSILSIDLNVAHVYRAQLNQLEGKIYFYIDGSEVANIDVPATSWDTDNGPRIGTRLISNNDGIMRIGDLNFSRSVVSY